MSIPELEIWLSPLARLEAQGGTGHQVFTDTGLLKGIPVAELIV